ncbi:D-Ala-D-Ala carboxypeptidase family metallohydrolase [Agrobacterium sp.]|uniref:D-Ala-D-Ala carboxypeptidase family metallohydrolase n=1 Tax=Agrobacterium sp. TaxID=361 RepID=UPI0028AB0B4C|nr:D-Ala-D-Ala carboxypeptidase family metallohydrolase [Agrobacterium sp.]
MPMVEAGKMTSAWRQRLLVAVSLLALSGCVSAVTDDGDTASLSPTANSTQTASAENTAADGKATAPSTNGGYVDPSMVSASQTQAGQVGQQGQEPHVAEAQQMGEAKPDLAAAVHQSTSISAGNTSIFANNAAPVQDMPVAGEATGSVPDAAYVPVPGVNPALSSVYSAPAQPKPPIAEVQPQTLQAQAAAMSAAAAARAPTTAQPAAPVATPQIAAPMPPVAASTTAKTDETPSGKSGMTLAAFFAGAAKKRSGKTAGNEPADDQAGVEVAQLPTDSATDISQMGIALQGRATMGDEFDDEHLEQDDAPAGLAKLASLSGLTRVAPNGLVLQTEKVNVGCFKPELVQMIRTVENHYKRPAIVTSGYRPPKGGVRRGSKHHTCEAADVQIKGVSKWELATYLRSLPNRGGVGTYCHTESVHMDIGEARDWNWRCRRTTATAKKG